VRARGLASSTRAEGGEKGRCQWEEEGRRRSGEGKIGERGRGRERKAPMGVKDEGRGKKRRGEEEGGENMHDGGKRGRTVPQP